MRDHLARFELEINHFAPNDCGIIDQASLISKTIYHTVRTYKEKHPEWIFLRHEDLYRDSLMGFTHLFDGLNLNYVEDIRNLVDQYSRPQNFTEVPAGLKHSIKRNRRANMWNWKNRLTEREVDRVRDKVKDISSEFYSDTDWRKEL